MKAVGRLILAGSVPDNEPYHNAEFKSYVNDAMFDDKVHECIIKDNTIMKLGLDLYMKRGSEKA